MAASQRVAALQSELQTTLRERAAADAAAEHSAQRVDQLEVPFRSALYFSWTHKQSSALVAA